MIFKYGKRTRSTFFILPLTLFPVEFYPSVVNTYLKDENNPKLKNKVFIVLEKDNSLTNKCINTLKTFSTFQEYYTISDYIVVIMNLLEAYQEDYRLFKLGKYSKFSNKAKEVILRFYSPTTKELELILNPTEKARKAGETYLNVILPDDAELFSKPTVKEETFILNNLIKLIE